jgi:perosamine synthetase
MSTTTRTENAELAINGGKPVRTTWLPYGRQSVTEDDINAVTEVLRGDWLTQGPNIALFEQAVANACGMKYAVAVNTGTAALHVAYYAAGVRAGDEIVMPGMSFAATANAALYLDAKPVFADIEPGTGCIDVNSASKLITPKTKAIVGVDFAGQPCDLGGLRQLADKHKLPLVIDGAHSLGATYKGKPAAQVADLTTFSFHPVKSITTGEGGAIVTNNAQYAEAMRVFRTHGIDKDADHFVNENDGPWYHEMQELGFNYRITDFQAALGASQMKRLNEFVARRSEIAKFYRSELGSLTDFECLAQRPDTESAHHLFPLLVKKQPYAESRKFAVTAFHAENIGVQIHYIPIYQHPYYQKNVCAQAPKCPNTDTFYQRVINLPIFPLMSQKDAEDVVQAVRKIDGAFGNQ